MKGRWWPLVANTNIKFNQLPKTNYLVKLPSPLHSINHTTSPSQLTYTPIYRAPPTMRGLCKPPLTPLHQPAHPPSLHYFGKRSKERSRSRQIRGFLSARNTLSMHVTRTPSSSHRVNGVAGAGQLAQGRCVKTSPSDSAESRWGGGRWSRRGVHGE